jgi:plastocyanin
MSPRIRLACLAAAMVLPLAGCAREAADEDLPEHPALRPRDSAPDTLSFVVEALPPRSAPAPSDPPAPAPAASRATRAAPAPAAAPGPSPATREGVAHRHAQGIRAEGGTPALAPPPAEPARASAPPAEASPPPQQVFRASMGGLAFRPARIEVTAGTTVVWRNDDDVAHTVTARNGSWGRTFDTPGTYAFYCQPHPEMTGTLVVKPRP